MEPKSPLADVILEIPCTECGEAARLVGIEKAPENGYHFLTFQCPQDHVTITTSPTSYLGELAIRPRDFSEALLQLRMEGLVCEFIELSGLGEILRNRSHRSLYLEPGQGTVAEVMALDLA